MTSFLANLAPLISTYGYLVLFLVGILEGPVVGVVAGALAAANELNLVAIFLALFAADIVGDILYYLLGRWSSWESLKRFAERLGLTAARFEPIERKFEANDWKVLLFGKTQPWGSVILYFAGTVRMGFGRFVWWNVVGTIPKVLLFEFVGYFFGQTIANAQHYADYISVGAFAASLLLLGGYWLFKRYLESKISSGS